MVEVLRFTKEIGFVGGQQVDHGLPFGGAIAGCDVLVVLAEIEAVERLETARQATDEQYFLGLRDADAGDLENQFLEHAEFGIADRDIAEM